MTIVLLLAGLGAIVAMAVIGSRTYKHSRVRETRKTPATPVPAQPAAYFERYLPKKVSGHGEPL